MPISPCRLGAALLVAVIALTGAAGCAERSADGPRRAASDAVTFDRSLHGRLPPDVRTAASLRVAGGGSSYPPLTSFAADGHTRVGFEPDFVRALGTLLGIRLDVVGGEFTEHLRRVHDHEVDLAVDSLSDTAERERYADFVSYLSSGTSILVARGNPDGVTDLGDLCGKAVGVEEGSAQHDLALRRQPGCGDSPMVLRAYDENAEAIVQLRTGSLDAALMDYPVAVGLSRDPETGGHFQLASDAQYEPAVIGIAVAKDRPQLRDALQAAVNRLITLGAYGQMLARWGMKEAAVDRSTVNLSGAPTPAT